VRCSALGDAQRTQRPEAPSRCYLERGPRHGIVTGEIEAHQTPGILSQSHSLSCTTPPEWTVGTNLRRCTRLSNGFSRKFENHVAAAALQYFVYNLIRIHRTLRTSPAMAAGVTSKLWEVSDLVALLEAAESKKRHD
jgi:hypothetical protein